VPVSRQDRGSAETAAAGQWRDVSRDLVRAASGGMIFGIPLLYTMEVWWVGQQATPPRLLLGLVAATVPAFLLVRVGGFWSRPARSIGDAAVQTVQAMGIALLSVAVVLVVLQRITWPTPLPTALGMVVYEAVPFAVGAAIAGAAIAGASDDLSDRSGPSGQRHSVRDTVRDLGATAIGALFLGLAIAPTDEVPMLAAGIPGPWLVALIALSLAVSYTIVFASGFLDERKRRAQMGLLQRPLTETLAAYLVALLVSALMLGAFDNLALDAPPHEILSRIIVLGLPAAVGGSAGRLVV
jgi:putative integral membrane protein (TIGR02587 family)